MTQQRDTNAARSATPERAGMPRRPVLVLGVMLAVLTVLRLWLCTRFELIADEAYYWLWARHLDWSYYSKGPVVAWVIALGTWLAGNTELGVRGFSVLLGGGTLVLMYRLGRQLFSPQVGFWAAVLAMVTPLLVIGSMLMTIDPISVFLWFAAANVFWVAKDRDHLGPWLATGLLVGIGMLAKYTNVVLLISFAAFLAWSPEHRRRLARPGFWIMGGVALLCLTPVLWWNSQNEWITFTHLQERGALDQAWRFSAKEFFGYLGGQLAAFSPFVVIGVIAALLHAPTRRRAPTAYRYLTSLTLPLLLFYTGLALNDEGEANWTAPAMMSGMILLAAMWTQLATRYRAARVMAGVALVTCGLGMVVMLGWSGGLLPGEPTPIRKLFNRTRGWQAMAERVEQARVDAGADILICRDRGVASRMAFYTPGHATTYIPSRDHIANQFSLWPGYRELASGTDALFVTRYGQPDPVMTNEFATIERAGAVTRRYRDRDVRDYDLFICRGMRAGE